MTHPVDRWSGHYAGVSEHEALAAVLSAEQRAWLADMADVLPPGWVIPGMATPARGGVVPDSSYPGRARLVVAPPGPGGCSPARGAIPGFDSLVEQLVGTELR
jgi:hypothetical protein